MSNSSNAGRPTVITPKVVSKLVKAFQSGNTVRDACWYAGISHETYYSHVRNDDIFADKMAYAQMAINRKAREVVFEAIERGDLSAAKWWLERKEEQEMLRDEQIEKQIDTPPSQEEMNEAIDYLIELRKMRGEYGDEQEQTAV